MSGLGLGYRFHLYLVGTPIIAEGKLFLGIGASWDSFLSGYDKPTGYPGAIHFAALDATTGAKLWVANQSGNSQQPFAATYYNGQTTLPNGTNYRTGPLLIMPEQMGISVYNATNGSKLWYQWLGHQVFTSVAVAEDLRVGGLKFYAGSDSFGITCFNGTAAILKQNVTVIGEYTAGAQCPSSPALYDGKLYACSSDGNLYCFNDRETVPASIWAEDNKGAEIWANETVSVAGRLTLKNQYPNPFDPSIVEALDPGVPNATISISLTKPDLTSVNLTATTDNLGYFETSFKMPEVGNWGWVAFYEGITKPAISYGTTYSEYNPINVLATPVESTPTPEATPTPTASPTPQPTQPPATETPTATSGTVFGNMPAEYLAAVIAVVLIVIVAIVAFFYMKRKKK